MRCLEKYMKKKGLSSKVEHEGEKHSLEDSASHEADHEGGSEEDDGDFQMDSVGSTEHADDDAEFDKRIRRRK